MTVDLTPSDGGRHRPVEVRSIHPLAASEEFFRVKTATSEAIIDRRVLDKRDPEWRRKFLRGDA